MMEFLGITLEVEKLDDGEEALFTSNQAEGAIPNKKRVTKHLSEPTDYIKTGTLGTVIGSVAIPKEAQPLMRAAIGVEPTYAYWVKFDVDKRPLFVLDYKIKQLD